MHCAYVSFSTIVQELRSYGAIRFPKNKYPKGAPELEELSTFLDESLPEQLKLPVPEATLMSIVRFKKPGGLTTAPFIESDLCSLEEFKSVLRVSTEGCLSAVYARVIGLIMPDIPASDASESSFHQLWDSVIGAFLRLLFPDALVHRDTSIGAGAGHKRPDFSFIIRNVCVLRGEEKALKTSGDPKMELCVKTIWIYDPAPYVFGRFWQMR